MNSSVTCEHRAKLSLLIQSREKGCYLLLRRMKDKNVRESHRLEDMQDVEDVIVEIPDLAGHWQESEDCMLIKRSDSCVSSGLMKERTSLAFPATGRASSTLRIW